MPRVRPPRPRIAAARARRLSRAIIAAGLDDIGVGALARFTPAYRSRALWEEMRAAGFAVMEWGLESACQDLLDSMRKGTRVETAADVLEAAAAAGVANEVFVMFGFPGETEERAKQTVGFLREHRDHITRTMIDVLDVYPDSPLGRDPELWGVDLDDGAVSMSEGMGLERARVLATGLVGQEAFDPRRFSSEPVRSIAKVNAARQVHGMLRTHGLMTRAQVVDALGSGRGAEVYPVVLGELSGPRGGGEWSPVAADETPVMNLRASPPRKRLTGAEADAFRLADGTRSFDEITTAGDVVAERRRFVADALDSGRALAFARRWEP